MKRLRKTEGFTLLEMIVVVGLVGIVTSTALATILSAQRTWATGSRQAIATNEIRRVLTRTSRELALTTAAQIQSPPANGVFQDSISFRIPEDQNGDGSVLNANGVISEWSRLITYGRSANNSFLRTLAPQGPGPGAQETLASFITAAQFRRQAATPDLIEIRLTASTVTERGRRFDHTVESRVKLRN